MNHIEHIRAELLARGLDAILVTDEKNQRYAAGFPFTDGAVLVGREKAFLITEFALGFRDGRSFCPGGEMAGEEELRREFCIRNFRLLARLHDHGIIHGGFTPATDLWRPLSAPDGNGGRMELAWIDVATCRRCTAGGLQRNIPDDFANFMRFFDFSAEERLALLREYCDASEIVRFSPGELSEAVDRALAARAKKRK